MQHIGTEKFDSYFEKNYSNLRSFLGARFFSTRASLHGMSLGDLLHLCYERIKSNVSKHDPKDFSYTDNFFFVCMQQSASSIIYNKKRAKERACKRENEYHDAYISYLEKENSFEEQTLVRDIISNLSQEDQCLVRQLTDSRRVRDISSDLQMSNSSFYRKVGNVQKSILDLGVEVGL